MPQFLRTLAAVMLAISGLGLSAVGCSSWGNPESSAATQTRIAQDVYATFTAEAKAEGTQEVVPVPSPTTIPTASSTSTTGTSPTTEIQKEVKLGQIKGKVVDHKTGIAIEGAQLILGKDVTTSNPRGGFLFDEVAPGPSVIVVTREGYETASTSAFSVSEGETRDVAIEMFPAGTFAHPEDPMATNQIDPAGAQTEQEAIRLARLQGLTGPIDKVEQRRLTGEYLVNYKLGDDIYTTRTSLDHDVWMLVSDDREWYVVAVCGNLAVAIPEYSLVLLVSFISSMNVPTPTKSSISMPSPAQEVIAFLSDRDYPHSSSNYWPQSLLELYTVSLADVQEQRVTTGLGLKKGNPMSSLVESLPESGRLEVDTKVTADVNISAYAARQKVNGFVLSDISYMMHAGDPTLVLAERIYWRVPVILSFTSRGDVGEVGAIDVDVETGQMHATPN